jgi:hypothetical protein
VHPFLVDRKGWGRKLRIGEGTDRNDDCALKTLLIPEIVTASEEKRAWAPKTLPVRRWQARQWHTETRIGSVVTRA